MKTYKVFYDRTEKCVVEIKAENKSRAKEVWMESNWNLDNEKSLSLTSKIKKVEETFK